MPDAARGGPGPQGIGQHGRSPGPPVIWLLADARASRSPGTALVPVYGFQKLIIGKYKLRILWDLQDGPRRYGEIRQGLLTGHPGTKSVAPRVLSRELKALVQFQMIERRDYALVPPKVEYRLTSEGESLLPVISAIHAWGVAHLVRDAALPERAVKRD